MKVYFITENEYSEFMKIHKGYIFRAIEFTHSLEKSTALLSKASVAPLAEQKYEIWVSEKKVKNSTIDEVTSVSSGNLIYSRFEDDEKLNLENTTYNLYKKIFSILKKNNLNLVRIWNYVPNILDESGTLERYRQFNIGRNKAWEEFGPKDTNNKLIIPAASGIGALGGPLKIGVLFSKEKPVHINNPRQISAYNYSNKYGPKPPMFSRATYLPNVGLFISGTASIVGENSLHHGDHKKQTIETMRNIELLISKKNLVNYGIPKGYSLKDITDWRIYVKDIYGAKLIEKTFLNKLKENKPNYIFLHDDICRDNLLVEIEGTIFTKS
ncbi:MAG: hypothetical protein PF542_05250 [Nanoarchaeota archaeon]|jgi:chorismate lyase/3-hydroxybenzoate synthase|nr:hypothetical protein [Nanoarchaeota archaeon]